MRSGLLLCCERCVCVCVCVHPSETPEVTGNDKAHWLEGGKMGQKAQDKVMSSELCL